MSRRDLKAVSGADLDEAELREIVAKLARSGNMPAARFYFETWIRPEASEGGIDPLAEVDEIAEARLKRRGA